MRKYLNFNGTQLKSFAIFAMLLDHIALVLLGVLTMPLIKGVGYTQGFLNADLTGKLIIALYYGFRSIGRMAFPIFCFLIAEGVKHTKNRFKYLLRLFVFALLSEIPFDLAIYHKWFYLGKQNVFFTLLGGALLICIIEWLYSRFNRNKILPFVLSVVAAFVLLFCINSLRTDYSYKGALLVLMLYLFGEYKAFGVLSGALLLSTKRALLSFIPLYFYNGERGRCSKLLQYGFYAFYPAHLTLLYLIRVLIY